MIVGVPKEIQNGEYRVGMVPSVAGALVKRGHRVLVERGAGEGAGYEDERYAEAGAQLAERAADVWSGAEMIVKVSAPEESEFGHLRRNLILFCYLHLAALPDLARALQNGGVHAIGCETIQTEDGALPLLKPISEIAGRMATQKGATFLERSNGGRGVLLGGVPGTRRGRVVIIGGGVVGNNAAKIAIGMGADVTLLDVNLDRLEFLDHIFQGRLHTLYSNPDNIHESVSKCDLLIGAVLIPGARSPRLVTEETVKAMKSGAVIIDVSVDQGGIVETVRPTTHENPTFMLHGKVHYGVTNITGTVSRTSTMALTNASTPYVLKLADKGFAQAIQEDQGLYSGVNAFSGHITYEAVADAVDMPYKPLSVLL
ncbi:MAG: alanine dehydrogenase [Myxococcales bacterium]|nr:MAG: alanine dehydrogenase [Myxococcales bacterium]